MPKREDIKSILIVGSGPIVIGQACEFDYSGTQACKALRDNGYRVILVNSNPATIMTDPEIADATYIEPVNWQTLEKIIEKEKPDLGVSRFNSFMHLSNFSLSSALSIASLLAPIISIECFSSIPLVARSKETLSPV